MAMAAAAVGATKTKTTSGWARYAESWWMATHTS
jgi:hypothetical protein